MLLGRSPALWIGLFQAAVNTAVVVFGITWDATQVAVLNAFGVSLLALLANREATGTLLGRGN